MESDATESTESVLTSTMQQTTDAVPSSSSDATHAETSTSDKPPEDPISSTSDEVDRVAISTTQPDATSTDSDKDDKHDIDKEADLFANEYNLATISGDKITENVEDIVSDLENLLGDTSNDYKLPVPKPKYIEPEKHVEPVVEPEEKVIINEVKEMNEPISETDVVKTDEIHEVIESETNDEVSDVKTEEEVEVNVAAVPPNEEISACETQVSEQVNTIIEGEEEEELIQEAPKPSEPASQPAIVEQLIPDKEVQEEAPAVIESIPVVENNPLVALDPIIDETQENSTVPEETTSEAVPESTIIDKNQEVLSPIPVSTSEPVEEPVSFNESNTGSDTDEPVSSNAAEESMDITPTPEVSIITEHSFTVPETRLQSDEPQEIVPQLPAAIVPEFSSEIVPEVSSESVPELPSEIVPELPAEVTAQSDAMIQDEPMDIDEELAPKESKIETSMFQPDLESTMIEDEEEEPTDEKSSSDEVSSSAIVAAEPTELSDSLEAQPETIEGEQEQHSDMHEVVDHEAELVKAALDASLIVNEGNKLDEQIEQEQLADARMASDEDVIRAAMDCTRNDEEDLIKAAQECQERELYDDDDDDDDSEPETAVDDIPEEATPVGREESTEEVPEEDLDELAEEEPEDDPYENVKETQRPNETRRVRLVPSQEHHVQDYQKPLNIVVDPPAVVSVVKEAESTTNEDNDMNKESSDEDKQEEYSSKISQSQELKITIRKTKAEESSSILKIYDPKEPMPEISPSESETDPESECPLPKLVIKQSQISPKVMSPIKITFKPMPMVKPDEQMQQKSSPKLIIKPIVKPDDEQHHSPKITIRPIPKPEEHERCNSPKITIKPLIKPTSESCISPKIKIKPIPKPEEEPPHEEERIVLKISKSRDATPKCEEIEKLGKIKLKFSMGGGHAHIVSEDDTKHSESEYEVEAKRSKMDMSLTDSCTSMQDSFHTETDEGTPEMLPAPTPKRRGRPRKVPLQVRLEDEEPVVMEQSEPEPENRSTRPKRSCRGPSVRDTLGMKPRKPRERGRGRGRGRGSKALSKKERLVESKLKLLKEAAITAQIDASFQYQNLEMKIDFEEDDEDNIKHDHHQPEQRHEEITIITEEPNPDVDMFEEDTRMSADTNSRAQTPAKQITIHPIVADAIVEESQSSVLSSATSESLKMKKPKMEIEPEGAVISADQLAEYYWGGGGPYMLQEQVAQYLGIKSFKRKYPGIPRRQVDMQERDFIRESGLASEHMCDLGLTAVNSADILDLMYSDFQHKYEEYCKHQRDRQTKDITNKQKALSIAASQEKNKIDIMQQAVESAAQWNANFNKTRREERKACMDLQTFTINYPKGRMKQVNRPKIGHYPIALVPGQYTDYYKNFTPTELNNLPLNTMLYHSIHVPNEEDSQSDGSGSESDSSTSGSDSSDSDSSEDDCNICSPQPLPGNKRVYT